MDSSRRCSGGPRLRCGRAAPARTGAPPSARCRSPLHSDVLPCSFVWSTSVHQDLLVAAFLLSFLLLCLRPAFSQAALAALWLGLSNNSAHNWFHLGDKHAWRRYRTRALCNYAQC